jgi:hypothetical protein
MYFGLINLNHPLTLGDKNKKKDVYFKVFLCNAVGCSIRMIVSRFASS